MVSKNLFFLAALSLLTCACNSSLDESLEPDEKVEVALQLSMFDWSYNSSGNRNSATRAADDELAYPISILYSQGDNTALTVASTIESGTSVHLSLPNGEYTLYAICGLPKSQLPKTIDEDFSIPQTDETYCDFTVGTTNISIVKGVCTPAAPSMIVEHKMGWFDMTITNVPESIKDIKLFMQGQCKTYSIGSGWKTPSDLTKCSQIPIEKSTQEEAIYKSDVITPPNCEDGKLTLVVEVTDTTNHTKLMSARADKGFSPGTHLTIIATFTDFAEIESDISMGNWSNDSYSGGLEDYDGRPSSLPATIIAKYTSSYQLFPHKPMLVTLNELRGLINNDFSNIEVYYQPEITVSRWAIAPKVETAENLYTAINDCGGWDSFNEKIAATGHTPIDKEATNVIAYYFKDSDVFYLYNFVNSNCEALYIETSDKYVFYPLGIIDLIR